MPTVSSTHTVGHAQRDGRRYVTEAHTDNTGTVFAVEYLAAVGTDYVAVRDARATAISDQLAEAEARALADDGA
jgi:hypothetical protein